jgi:hypothetical protein
MWYIIVGFLAAPVFGWITRILMQTIFYTLDIAEKVDTVKLDKLLQKIGTTGPRQPSGEAGCGWHWGMYKGGIVVAFKMREQDKYTVYVYTYNVYIHGKAPFNAICKYILPVADAVTSVHEESLGPYHTQYEYVDFSDVELRPRQQGIARNIVENYNHNNSASSSRINNALVIVSGPPGVGKTTLGEIVGRMLRIQTSMNVKKYVVDFTTKEYGIAPLFYRRTDDTILILQLNEYDVAMDRALSTADDSDKIACLAQNKSSLNNVFDFMAKQDRLVVIATTNNSKFSPDHDSFMRRFDSVIKW